ncbi:hypothetical protein PInf_005649 [Phytophthora infestans]|nr:hypothetical protein PInf_005649 [Phytophthora infestans]
MLPAWVTQYHTRSRVPLMSSTRHHDVGSEVPRPVSRRKSGLNLVQVDVASSDSEARARTPLTWSVDTNFVRCMGGFATPADPNIEGRRAVWASTVVVPKGIHQSCGQSPVNKDAAPSKMLKRRTLGHVMYGDSKMQGTRRCHYRTLTTPAKSGEARNESSSPDVSAARFAAATELSVSFEDEADIGPDAHDYDDYEDKTPEPEPGAAIPETATLSSGMSGATRSLSKSLADELDDVARPDPVNEEKNDDGAEPSLASAKRSALLKAPRPPINGDTPAAKRVFGRVQALMQNDE